MTTHAKSRPACKSTADLPAIAVYCVNKFANSTFLDARGPGSKASTLNLRSREVLRADSMLFKNRLYVFVNAGNCGQDSIKSAGNGVPLKIKTALCFQAEWSRADPLNQKRALRFPLLWRTGFGVHFYFQEIARVFGGQIEMVVKGSLPTNGIYDERWMPLSDSFFFFYIFYFKIVVTCFCDLYHKEGFYIKCSPHYLDICSIIIAFNYIFLLFV